MHLWKYFEGFPCRTPKMEVKYSWVKLSFIAMSYIVGLASAGIR